MQLEGLGEPRVGLKGFKVCVVLFCDIEGVLANIKDIVGNPLGAMLARLSKVLANRDIWPSMLSSINQPLYC